VLVGRAYALGAQLIALKALETLVVRDELAVAVGERIRCPRDADGDALESVRVAGMRPRTAFFASRRRLKTTAIAPGSPRAWPGS